MAITTLLGTTWDQLREQLSDHDHDGNLWAHWQDLEPDLLDVADPDALRELSHSTDPETFENRDRLLSALLRIGGVQGHDDTRAAQLVGLLMEPGCLHLAALLRHRGITDCDHDIASALWVHVRTAPVQRWQRRCAANLMWSVRKTVEAEHHRSATSGDALHRGTVDLAALHPEENLDLAAEPDHGVGATHRSEQDLVDLLAWATATQVLSPDAAALLVDLVTVAVGAEQSRPQGWRAGCELKVVADRRGVPRRTLARHREAAVSALRAACRDQLDQLDQTG